MYVKPKAKDGGKRARELAKRGNTGFRPAGLNMQRIKALCAGARMGLPIGLVLKKTRTPKTTFYRWLAEARDLIARVEAGHDLKISQLESMQVELYFAIDEAYAGFFEEQITAMKQAATDPKHWTARAWLCERLDPQSFGRHAESRELDKDEEKADKFYEASVLINAMKGTIHGLEPPAGMLPSAWTTFKRTDIQVDFLSCEDRFVGAPCGRGSGKTEIALRKLVLSLGEQRPHDNPIYFYACPTNQQAMRVGWDRIRSLIPPRWLRDEHKSDQCFETVFGSRLYIFGLDKPARIEGPQYDGGVVDESSDQRPGSFDKSIFPALTHREGWAWRIGVPKRTGVGATEFRKWCEEGERGEVNGRSVFHWASSIVLPADKVEHAKQVLDPVDYAEQFDARWQSASGGIFYAFDEQFNVRPCAYRPNLPLVIGCDFNVDPMCWVFGHRFANRLEIIDELYIQDTVTEKAIAAAWEKWKSHEGGFEFYCDASGGQRRSSGQVDADNRIMTDLTIIMNHEGFRKSKGGRRLVFPYRRANGKLCGNPPLRSRFASTNALCCNAADERRLFIAPSCDKLIEDLRSRHRKPESDDPEDIGDLGHMSDALGYIIWRIWPVEPFLADVSRSVIIKKDGR